MTAQGMLFLSRTPPRTSLSDSGQVVLTLHCVHRIAQRQVEAWTIRWRGLEAGWFYSQHQHDLVPGQPLQVTLERVRAHVSGPIAEMRGEVVSLALAPRKEEVAA
jgi:hypothetical protein